MLQLEVKQIYTTYYWIVVMWQHDRGVTWHVGWGLLILVTTLRSLCALFLVKVTMKYVWFVTWPLDKSVTWLCRWDHVVLSHHPAKSGMNRTWESGDITFFICHVTTWLMYRVTCRWGSLILSHYPTRFVVHRPCESGNIMPLFCHVITWSICYMTLRVGSLHPKSPSC